MAKQVKPFEVPVCLGYTVYCSGEDFYEPEGIIYFDGPPKIGDKAILCDKKEWTVTKESNKQMEITMELLW